MAAVARQTWVRLQRANRCSENPTVYELPQDAIPLHAVSSDLQEAPRQLLLLLFSFEGIAFFQHAPRRFLKLIHARVAHARGF